jgi:CPA1 family monovalent cation:H+ antiporter
MREYLQQLLVVLAIGSAVAIGAKRINVPFNVALVVVGLALVLMNVLPQTTMDPGVVLLLFLPILVFQGALSADDVSLRRAARPILTLAFPAVAVSLLATALIASWEIGLPYPIALLLGAILAITDTVSVLLAFRSIRVPHRLAAIMEGESLFNDGTALVLVSVCATVAIQGYADPAMLARMLFIAVIAGAVLGASFGMVGAVVLRHAPDDLTAILASLVAVFATSLLTEEVGGSAVIAVVIAGVLIGREMREHLEPSRVLALQGFWETASFVINVWLFLLVGMQLRSELLLQEAWPILLAVVALHAGRALAVYGLFGFLSRLTDSLPWRWQHVIVFGNVKGALSMAAVLSLPPTVPYRDRLIAIVFGVTLVTLVTQALPFRRFLTWIGVASRSDDETADQCRAVLISSRRAQLEIDNLLAAGLISRHDHAEQRSQFQRAIIEAERILRRIGHNDQDAVAAPTVLTARKAAILDAARRGLITDRTAARHVAALDAEIVRVASREHERNLKEPPMGGDRSEGTP